MPTSHHSYISRVIEEVRKQKPTSILDIGVGFGKWGHLFREYLDVMKGRVFKKDWQLKLEGVEIFKPYIMGHQKYIYDKIHIGDIVDIIDNLGSYDLIFGSDFLEHLPKEKGLELLPKLRAHTDKLILVVPTGTAWLNSQGEMYGNKFEAHVSAWEKSELSADYCQMFDCNNKKIGLYIYA